MSEQQSPVPAVAAEITPATRDIGAFDVRRALPAAACRSVGPFVFFDQMGPVILEDGQAMDVRPHPHIGLSTLTWLFEGAIRHQDSLGYDLVIRPGEVNWMTAGRGIVHSERSPLDARDVHAPLYGIQTWMALPLEREEIDPAFYHYGADEIPKLEREGWRLALIAGRAFGRESPVKVESEMFYAELRLDSGAGFEFPADIQERAIYICRGELEIDGARYRPGRLLSLNPGVETTLRTTGEDCLCMLLGGPPLDAPRHLYWNFVSSSRERIEAAKRLWREGGFDRIPGDPEFIPLPEDQVKA